MSLRSLRWSWNRFGQTDPFWAVLVDPSKVGRRWEDPAEKARFFELGREDVTRTLGEVKASGLRVPHHRALDFGCGVGRLTQGLAEHFERVVGVDIATTMVSRARRENRHGDRVRYLVNERGDLTVLDPERFDLILSLLVLQHMEPIYALGYVAEFVRVLTPSGAAVFNLPHVSCTPPSAWRRLWARWRGRPLMEMHGAGVDAVVNAVRAAGGVVAMRREVDWGAPGSLYIVTKAKEAQSHPGGAVETRRASV
jgi:SAM-dependent methyltransferase